MLLETFFNETNTFIVSQNLEEARAQAGTTYTAPTVTSLPRPRASTCSHALSAPGAGHGVPPAGGTGLSVGPGLSVNTGPLVGPGLSGGGPSIAPLTDAQSGALSSEKASSLGNESTSRMGFVIPPVLQTKEGYLLLMQPKSIAAPALFFH